MLRAAPQDYSSDGTDAVGFVQFRACRAVGRKFEHAQVLVTACCSSHISEAQTGFSDCFQPFPTMDVVLGLTRVDHGGVDRE